MAEKKFNFYNFFKFYYKNINESEFIFFYDCDVFRDFEWELYADNISKVLINYIGFFYIISSNFIMYTDLCIFNTILKNRKPPMWANFKVKKLFYKTLIKNYTFIKKNNINPILIFLESYN